MFISHIFIYLIVYLNWHLYVLSCVFSLSYVWFFENPSTVACQFSLFMARNVPGRNTRVDCHFLLQGIFQTKGLNPHLLHLLHWQANLLSLFHLGSLMSVRTHVTYLIILHIICLIFNSIVQIEWTLAIDSSFSWQCFSMENIFIQYLLLNFLHVDTLEKIN